MPVELIIQSNEYLNQYKNGTTYAANTADVTYNLAATVMERIQYKSTLNVSWGFTATPSNTLTVQLMGGDLWRFKKGGGSLMDDGFSVGDDLDMIYTSNGTVYTIDGDVTIIQTDWMYVQFTSTPTGTNGGVSSNIILKGKSSLTALIYKFGLIDNAETFNTASKVSGNEQAFYASSLSIGVPQTMIPQGTYRDWVTGTVTIEKQLNIDAYTQQFDIIHDFIINPYYLDGQLSAIQNGYVRPLFAGGNTLKHVLECEFRTGLSNPNSSKTARMDWILGSVGDFGENMNGFNNLYSIASTSYENASALGADGILTAEQTVIRLTVEKTGGSFVSTDKIGGFISYLPTVSEYIDTITPFETNFIYDNLHCLADGVPVTGTGFIDEISATVSGGDILLVIKTTYTTAQQTILANATSPYFALAVQVGDVTLTNPNSDRVMILADALAYDTSPDIEGLITLNDFRYFAHDMVVGVDAGFTSYTGWNEDGVVITFDFDLDLSKAAFLNSFVVKLQAVNYVTLESFDLDSFEFDLGNIVSGGVQQINVNTTRGYTLQSGSQFNEVTLTTGALVGTMQNYTGTFAQKISWQEWIQNLAVDQVFYDSAEPNDNFNYKTSNYTNGLNLHVAGLAIYANVYGENATLGTSGNTDYILSANSFVTVYDYNEDNLSPSPRYTGTIETFTSDGVTNLGGAIQTNGDDTLVKTTWVDNLGTFVSLWNYYAIHRVEPVNAQGYSIEELSSINTPPTAQIPIPEPPSILLDMSIVSGDLVTTALVDGSAINTNINYKLSSRLQSPNRKSEVDMLTFYTFNGPPATPKTGIIVKTDATTQWDYSDGSALDVTYTPSHSFATLDDVYLVSANVDAYAGVTAITLDFEITANINLTNFTSITALDLQTNSALTSITNPTTAAIFTNYDLNACNITGVLNVSGLTGLGGTFDVSSNKFMTSITAPSTTQTFSNFDASNCLLTWFDLTPMTNLTESASVTIDLRNNSLSAADVNRFLVDLDGMATGGFAGRVITIDGTNAAPDGTSGGYDGTTAKANLITKTFTVTTN